MSPAVLLPRNQSDNGNQPRPAMNAVPPDAIIITDPHGEAVRREARVIRITRAQIIVADESGAGAVRYRRCNGWRWGSMSSAATSRIENVADINAFARSTSDAA
jgi:hypothetical protein